MTQLVDLLSRNAAVAARHLRIAGSDLKNRALRAMRQALLESAELILSENHLDLREAESARLAPALLERLMLNEQRLRAMADGITAVEALEDPVGALIEQRRLANGLTLERRRTPLGVILVIFESRPNVAVECAALAVKSSNAVILRGGKESARTTAAIVAALRRGIGAQIDINAVQLVENPDRELLRELIRLDRRIDLVIPRGGSALQTFCRENATVPVLSGGIGICHLYVDRGADYEKALPIVVNAKTQRPSVCNALDTVLVHRDEAERFIPRLATALRQHAVELRADDRAFQLLNSFPEARRAESGDFDREWLSLVLSVAVVDSIEQAMEHIEAHGTRHSDAIVTEDPGAAEQFLAGVDSAAVYHNASTRFTDGGEFGLGAEVAVSTQKLHARGPFALEALTSYKWIVRGSGQTRS